MAEIISSSSYKTINIPYTIALFCIRFVTLICVVLLSVNEANSQNDSRYIEKVYLQTDRDFYISGEEMLFKAYLTANQNTHVKSKILYIEVVGINSEVYQKRAFLVNNSTVEGIIEIPDSLSSGSFMIKAYTNWHRNFENRYAFNKEIIIVNRFGQYGKIIDGLNSDSTTNSTINLNKSQSFRIIPSPDSITVVYKKPENISDVFTMEIYAKGEKVLSKFAKQVNDSIHFVMSKMEVPPGNLVAKILDYSHTLASGLVYNDYTSTNLTVSLNKPTYNTRQLVQLTIQLDESETVISASNLSASVQVVPTEDLLVNSIDINQWINSLSEIAVEKRVSNGAITSIIYDELNYKELKYPIESSGKIITGKVVNKSTREEVVNAKVLFSFKDTVPYLDYDITDSNGYFYISLPTIYANIPGYVQVWDASINNNNCEIVFDSETKTNDIKMQSYDAEFLSRSYSQNIKAFELSELFSNNWLGIAPPLTGEEVKPIFMGQSTTVIPRDFIKLNNFTEIVKEILPGVKMQSNEEGIYLRIMDEFQGSYYNDDPLVIINGLPVKNYNYLSALNSNDIDKIDVVRKYFVVGSNVFHGLVAIKLKKELNLEYLSGNTFFAVKNNVDRSQYRYSYPNYETESKKASRRPEFRNTIYWAPSITLIDNKALVSFYTSDMQGKFKVVVEGIVNGNLPVSAKKEFSVNDNF